MAGKHQVVPSEEWIEARSQLLIKEKSSHACVTSSVGNDAIFHGKPCVRSISSRARMENGAAKDRDEGEIVAVRFTNALADV